MKTLYPFQKHAVDEVLTHALHGMMGGVMLCAPTGAGKTVIIAHAIRNLVEQGKRVVFLAHREELLDQAFATLTGEGITAGLLVSSKRKCVNLDAPVLVASHGVLARRRSSLPHADIIVIDEAHHATAKTYQRLLLEEYGNAYRIGLSATPERLDGKGLNENHLFTHLVNVPVSIEELIERGRLAPVRYIAALDPKEHTLRLNRGDFNSVSVTRHMRTLRPKIVGAWKAFANDAARTAVFCAGTTQADELADTFNRFNIPAASVHNGTTPKERDANLKAFARGDIKVLVSVDLFIEGLDLPSIDTVLLARPTMSLRVHLQSIGRGMRSEDGKVLTVIDCAGNLYRHGLPTWDRRDHWSLEPQERQRDLNARMGAYRERFEACRTCFTARLKGSPCATCGDTPSLPMIEGELRKPHARSHATLRLGETADQDERVFAELLGYAMARGKTDALEWAIRVYEEHNGILARSVLSNIAPRTASAAVKGFLRRYRRGARRPLMAA